MGLQRRTPPPAADTAKLAPAPAPKVLVAAGLRFRPSDKGRIDKARARRKDWQAAGWQHYDEVGELRFATDLVADLISRCHVGVGWYPSPDDPSLLPEELPGADGEPVPAELPQPATIVAAREVLRRISEGSSGGMPEFARTFAVHLLIPGEGWVVSWPVEADDELNTPAGETWRVTSGDLIDTSSGGTVVKDSRANDAETHPVPDEGGQVIRIWRPHPNSWAEATSHTQAMIDDLDELALLRRARRTAHRSQLGAGILIFDASVNATVLTGDVETDDAPLYPDDLDPDAATVQTPQIADLIADAYRQVYEDEAAVASIVPLILQVTMPDGRSVADCVHYLTLDRHLDDLTIEERADVVASVARALPVPSEVTLGLADGNHWSAWLVDEERFKTAVAPLLGMMMAAWTAEILRPLLRQVIREANGVAAEAEIRKVCFWYDASDVISRPDPTGVIQWARDAGVVNDAFARRTIVPGATDGDEVDGEELVSRLVRQRAPMTAEYTAQGVALANDGVPLLIPAQDPMTGAPQLVPDAETPGPVAPAAGPDDTPAPPPPPPTGPPPSGPGAAVDLDRITDAIIGRLALRAAATEPDLATLARQLGAIERELFSRLLTAADAAVGRVMEILGAKVNRTAPRQASARRQELRAAGLPDEIPDWYAELPRVPLAQVCRRVGRQVVTAALGGDEEQIVRAELAAYATDWQRIVSDAADQAISLISVFAAGDPTREAAVLRSRAVYDESIQTSATFVTQLLTGDALRALFADDGPDLTVEQLGEIDRTLRVSPESLRRALAVAGGADPAAVAVAALAGEDVGGLTGGRNTSHVALQAGLRRVGYRWVYGAGMRGAPFEPHRRLTGREFPDFEDPALSTSGSGAEWVGPYFHPGDHAYCQCTVEPVYAAQIITGQT